MLTTTIPQKSDVLRTESRSEAAPLSQRYGSIGIQAVAAAARYADRRKSQPQLQAGAARIDQRFVESAV